MTAVSTNPKDWVHVQTPIGGHLGEVIKAMVQELDNFQRNSDMVKNQVIIESASSFSVDLLGSLVGLERRVDESDSVFRTRISTWVNTIEHQTEQSIKDEVYRIAGVIPQVDSHPHVDFVTEYGMTKNEGIIRVLVPFNKWELWGDDITSRLHSIVAAGIAVIAESYDRYFEEFYDTATLIDWVITHLFAYPPLLGETLRNRVAFIGEATIGEEYVIGTGVDAIFARWDEGFWDQMYWDGGGTVVIRDVL